MNQMDLFEELTDIDDDLILEALQTAPIRRRSVSLRWIVTLAAVLTAVMLVMMTAVAEVPEERKDPHPSGWAEKYMEEKMDIGWSTDSGEGGTYELTIRHSAEYAEAVARSYSGKRLTVLMDAFVYLNDGTIEVKKCIAQGIGRVTVAVDNQIEGKPGTVYLIRVNAFEEGSEGSVHQLIHDLDCFQITPPSGVEVTLPPPTMPNGQRPYPE